MRRWLIVLSVSLAVALFISAIAVWAIRWVAIDDCLDRGGAWNHASRSCSLH